jgi:hypothetical protein
MLDWSDSSASASRRVPAPLILTPDNAPDQTGLGVIDRRGGEEANLIVNELIPLDQLDTRYTTGIIVRIDERERTEQSPRNRVGGRHFGAVG